MKDFKEFLVVIAAAVFYLVVKPVNTLLAWRKPPAEETTMACDRGSRRRCAWLRLHLHFVAR